MNKSVFYNKLYSKIMDAMKICDEGNVIDMRLYKNDSCMSSGEYSIFEVDALYEEIKDCDNWFVDFYENIKDANSAEFIDVVLWSDDVIEKTPTEDTPKTMSVEEFDAKWGEMPNRSEMDFETELEFIEDAFNMYETSGFSATYHSIGIDDGKDFDGVAFQVIGRASYANLDCDLEQLPMWHIEFEDGTKHMAFPEEITKIERERQTLAQNLHKEEEKPINQTDTMDRYEQIKNKLESFASEDELVEMWNKYVAENREKLIENITIYLNTADNLAMMMSWLSKEGIAKSFHNGNYDSRDRYIYECGDRLFTANSMFAIISTEGLERFYDDYISSAKKEWEKDSAKAITLWNQPYEEVRVEITKDWVKFFRRDDMLTCYTYRPLHLLKCDNYFISRVKATLEESCQYNEEEFNIWLKNDCDMPPFPISVIFTSDYTEYTCKVYGE